ncbi:MAG TPA: tetratricopeptide repeat protein [Verrucomicrobiae bacterium]|nr:tetratricopeptide repeat protein [Verrucomicrobiae bacterium]
MTDRRPDGEEAQAAGGKPRWIQRGVLAATCALVIGVYLYTARSGYLVSRSLNPAGASYNLLVQGFRAGQLSLKTEVPPELARLPNPYDRDANARYGVLDLSYYKGRLYLYFGVTPVLVLFWPYLAVTGHYLLQKDATLIFCLVGFLTSAGLLLAVWRRYFAEVKVGVAAGMLALGLATFTPFLLARCDVYETSISCGYAFTMLALAAIWKTLHDPERRGWWLAAASLAYGLAVGARPSVLFGAVILLIPVAEACLERRKVWTAVLAATVPIAFVGLGLMLYNALRFDNPFEFGWHYQMSGRRQDIASPFGLHYFWFNFRVLFLEPARWCGRVPYVHDIHAPRSPAGYSGVEHPFGILTTIPFVWMALAAPLAWRSRPTRERSTLRRFLTAVALLFNASALTLCFFWAVNARYELEFAPALVLLATVGVLSLERVLAPKSKPELPYRTVWRWAARCGWGVLLGFSVAFNLLASVQRCAEAHCDLGNVLLQQGKDTEAISKYDQALRLNPDFAEAHFNLGLALLRLGRVPEAAGRWEQALRLKPNYAEAHNNLGVALAQLGHVPEAIECYDRALQLKSDYAEAHYNLAVALARLNKLPEAIAEYQQAVRLKSDYAEAQNGWGLILVRLGRTREAVEHWEQALRLQPDYAEAHYNLGVALAGLNEVPEAIAQYQEAVRLKPDYADAHNNLGGVFLRLGRTQEAIAQFEQALRAAPGLVEAHYNLGVALEQTGKTQDAIRYYEQALRIRPDYAEAQMALTRLRAAQ